MKPKLLAYISGVVRNIKGNPLQINGISNHIHLLIQLSPANPVSQTVQAIKSNSSRWVHENYPNKQSFAWQAGYGAFTVSRSVVPVVFKYIENQETHHQKLSFKNEFLTFLKKNEIKYDEKFIWK